MDFQGAKDEVARLQTLYDELSIEVPKLEEQKKALEETIKDLQNDINQAEETQEYIRKDNIRLAQNHQEWLDKSKSTLKREQEEFYAYRSLQTAKIKADLEALEAEKKELEAEKNELDTLLINHVDKQKTLEEQIASFGKSVTAHAKEVARFNKDKEAFKEMQKSFKMKYGESSIKRIEAAIETKSKKADELTTEAQSLHSKAIKMLKDAKERNTLVSLKEDELMRKEKLLGAEIKRMEDKEKALNDRAAVYNSHN